MEVPEKTFVVYYRDNEAKIATYAFPIVLLEFFGHFYMQHEESGDTQSWFLDEFPLSKRVLDFLVNTFTRHYKTYGKLAFATALDDDAKLKRELATFSLVQMYELVHICDVYTISLLVLPTLKELMRRLLRMPTSELRAKHKNYTRNEPIVITSVIEAIVSDCARQSLLLDILRQYVRFNHLFDFIRDRFLPRAEHLVATGSFHFLAITANGTYATGDNKHGELAHKASTEPRRFYKVDLVDNVISVAAYDHCSLFLTSAGDLYSVGTNEYGQLGRDTSSTNSAKPGKVPLEFVLTMACGARHAAAVTVDGVFMWGETTVTTDMAKPWSPRRLPVDANIIEIGCGFLFTVLLSDAGVIYLSNTLSNTAREIPFPLAVVKVVCHLYGFTAMLSDGTLYAWGETSRDIKLAYNAFTALPQRITKFTDTPMKDIFAGMVMSIFVDENDVVYVPIVEAMDVMRLRVWKKRAPFPIKHEIIAGGVIDAYLGENDALLLKSDGLYFIGGYTNGPLFDADGDKFVLSIGHEQYADDPNVAKSLRRRRIEYKEGGANLACHVCQYSHLSSLFLNRASVRLFCGPSCLTRFNNLK